MLASELKAQRVHRILCHTLNVDPDTGEQLPVEPVELLPVPPTISELMERVASGDPINNFMHTSPNVVFDDEEGPRENDNDDIEVLRKNEDKYFVESDPLMVLEAGKQMRESDRPKEKPAQVKQQPAEKEPSPKSEKTDPPGSASE